MNPIDRYTEPYREKIEKSYEKFIDDYFNGSHRHADFLIHTISIGFIFYWIVGLIYFSLDYFHWPKKYFFRYKVQPLDKNSASIHDPGVISQLLKVVLINQSISISVGYVFYHYLPYPENPPLPPLTVVAFQFIGWVLIRETTFYYSHLLLHHRFFYRHIHKKHHQWQTPVAIAAVYCHPIEHLISNLFPVAAAPFLIPSHSLIKHFWMIYAILDTLNYHSGYFFPLTISPIFHDFHHLKFNCNYGSIGLLDWLHGTDKIYRESPYYRLPNIYWSLNPPQSFEFCNNKKSK